MSKTRFKVADRFLAVLLALIMVIGMMPVTVFAAAVDYPGKFTVTVKDGSQGPVDGAEISYEIKVNDSTKKTDSTTTDSDGVAGIDLSDYQEEIEGSSDTVTLSYTVTKTGFQTQTGSVTVEELEGTASVTLVAEVPETVQVTVSTTGDGTVTLNGQNTTSLSVEKGEQVTVVVTPGDNARVDSLTIEGTEESVSNKYVAYTTTVDADDNIQIVATFVTEVTVTATSNDGGTIKLNGQESPVTVDKGSSVPVDIKPIEGYQISSVTIDGQQESVSDVYSFSKNVVADSDVTISAQFVKEYTVIVTKDGNGDFTTTPSNNGGSVTVVTGSTVKVTATPEENYRVSKVVINSESTAFDDNTYDHDNPWTTELNVTKDYTIEITFAPTCFNITYTNDANGSVKVQDAKVDYDGSTTADITANEGYNVKSVKVNGTDVGFTQTNNKTVQIKIENITEDQKIEVTYEAIEEIDMPADVAAFKDDAIRTEDETGLYVYANDAVVTFSTDKEGISINGIPATGDQFKTNSITVSETTEIESIYLYYGNAWYSVELGTPIKIVIDIELDEPSLTPETPHANDYYNHDVKVDIAVEDTGDYSGIASVEYWVTNGETPVETKRETIYSNDGSEEILAKVERSIVISATDNNSDYVTVYLKVTDLAGNESNTSCQLKINSTPPEIKVEIDGTLHAEAETGYYNAKRTAKVTFTDRASTFDENAAVEGIKIEAVDGSEGSVSISKVAMISWSHNDDEHIATIEFATDANYKWSISYTNTAGLANNEIVDVTGDSVYEFTVDTKAPSSATIELDGSTWSEIVSVLTFGLWKNYSVTATVTETKDATSPVKDAVYYKDAGDSVLSEEELDQHFTDGNFVSTPYTISANEKFVIYARVTDYAGNTMYISTDGVIYDKTVGSIDIKPEAPNANGIYTNNVEVKISVDDTIEASSGEADQVSSGIKKIDYKIESVFAGSKDPVVTASGNLFTFDVENPTYDQLVTKWNNESDPLIINAKENNSDKVTVTVMVEDNAGNKYEATIDPALTIVVDEPTAVIVFGDDEYKDNRYDDTYFIAQSAKVIVTDRNASFNADRAFAGITITAIDSAKDPITLVAGVDYTISDTWEYSVVENRETHTATIQFLTDGNYTIGFNYLNNSEIEENRVIIADESFTKDATDPFGSITVAENTWDKLLSILTFGLYSNVKVDVTATADDATSPVKIEYYKTSNPALLSKTALDEQTFTTFEPFSVEPNEQFVIYLKITDYAGNYIYINSDGYIVDNVPSNIEITLDDPNSNDCYKGDVKAEIKVTEAEPYSGIQKIEYWIESDGVETQRDTLYSFNVSNPKQEDLLRTWTGSITVDSSLNNSSNVILYVTTTDNAGNPKTESVKLDIDITPPVIQLSYPSTDKDNNGNTCFDHTRTATVVITERTNHFDATAATAGIVITAKDASGADVANAYTISGWTTTEGKTPDEATHTATINFNKDANYTLTLSYTDKADNPHTKDADHPNDAVIVTAGSVAPFKFTVDTTPPTGTITATSAEGRTTTWDERLSSLTFGFWSRETITVTSTQTDVTSLPIASVEYYKLVSENANDKTTALTVDELKAITAWQPFTSLTIGANEQFVVYLKITDLAGNYTFISTDGLIVDDQAPLEETIAPEITVSPEQPINGFYNRDVKVDIKVTDPLVGGTYSGLKTVSYRVLNMGVETQSGTLYSFNTTNPKQEDLLQTWTGSITVNSELNNSNDVVIEIIAEDNSLNTCRKSESIKIDITDPRINVSYSNNNADSGTYFKENRTATIEVIERNFDPDDVRVTITNTDGVIPSLSGWTKANGTGNGDDTRWTATITYSADGDYTFDIAYTDLANNACSGAQYGNSVAPTAFTIDKTIPTISVVYDNNSAENTNYYKAERTATITITEHNFNAERVVTTITATDDGAPTTVPTVSGWSTNGNVHTATIRYPGDALYSFDIAFTDMAGNVAADFAQQSFYVDKTNPTLEITGVENNSANSGDVIPVVSYSDTNYDSSRVTITLTGANRGPVELDGSYADIHNGRTFTFKNFAKEQAVDDIYTLTATLTDKAGNTTEQTITFSVNRFGSNYTMSESTKALNGTYVKEPQDVVITETNANALEDITITLFKNNETITLVEGEDYRIDVVGGNGEWYQYTYTIFAKNFADDGVYRISIHSKDAAGNVAENTLDTKGTEISFGVDKTNPTLVVTNLESGKTYALENLTVIMSANDNLLLNSVVVYLDNDTTPYKTWSAEEIAEILAGNGEFTFDVSGDSTSAHYVRVVCTDAAGNETSEEFTNFFVTTNLWVRYYNNKPLFFGSIGGVVLLAALIVVIVVLKRRKKEEK